MTSKPWWHSAVCYEVYVRSFADSDGDGVGDLEGIRGRLPYLADLGVDAVWITPFYPSPMHDHGYDVADYCDVDPRFGSLADIDRLLTEAHALGLRVIVDVVPNHTSWDHPWFRDAITGPSSPKRDWYMFRPGCGQGPPNNWQSVFGGDAWALDPGSGDYYLHLFDMSQPDLNWRNPEVHEAFHDVLRFWFDRGVDGFRIDVAHGLYKDERLRNNPESGKPSRTWDQPETVEIWKEWRQVADTYADRMFVGEVFLHEPERVARYVGPDRLHTAFNFSVVDQPFEAKAFRDIAQRSLDLFLRDGTTPTWVLSNQDLVRHATRFGGGAAGRRRARAATAFVLALPGSPYIYQGEELGLEQSLVPPERRQDPVYFRSGRVGRDGARTPMPWSSEPEGHGFTTGDAWLPFDQHAATRNVEAESTDPASTLSFYRRALRLRRERVAGLSEDVRWLDVPDGVVAYQRDDLVAVTNFTDAAVEVSVPVAAQLLTSDDDVAVSTGTVQLPGATTAWLV